MFRLVWLGRAPMREACCAMDLGAIKASPQTAQVVSRRVWLLRASVARPSFVHRLLQWCRFRRRRATNAAVAVAVAVAAVTNHTWQEFAVTARKCGEAIHWLYEDSFILLHSLRSLRKMEILRRVEILRSDRREWRFCGATIARKRAQHRAQARSTPLGVDPWGWNGSEVK